MRTLCSTDEGGWGANMDDATFAKEFNAMVTMARRVK
jgi:hypothetical protein